MSVIQPRAPCDIQTDGETIDRAIYLTPDIQHQPRPLLHQLQLRRTLNLGTSALGLPKDLRERLLDGLAHALRVTTNVHVSLASQDRVRHSGAFLPDEVLHVNLAAVGLVGWLAGECAVECELALELLGVLWPFFLVQEVLGRTTAAVEE